MYEPRRPGPLVIDEPLRATLARLRVHRAVAAAPVLSPKDVAVAELRLGCAIRDEVWATIAALGRDPADLATDTELASATTSLPAGYVVFELDGRKSYWCVRRDPGDGEATQVFQWSGRHRRFVRRWPDLGAFLTAHYGLPSSPLVAEVGGTFTPRLATSQARTQARRVHHLHFGDGIVVDESFGRTHKLEVDFEGYGRKQVLASYVREIDAVPPADEPTPVDGAAVVGEVA